jgi:hypothetical protein
MRLASIGRKTVNAFLQRKKEKNGRIECKAFLKIKG